MKTVTTLLIAGVVSLGAMATQESTAAPGYFFDFNAPHVTAQVGSRIGVQVFSDSKVKGIKLFNASDAVISVQDTVSLDVVTLAPGMQLGMSCDSVRHLALSSERDVAYESVSCGSVLRFANQGGQQ